MLKVAERLPVIRVEVGHLVEVSRVDLVGSYVGHEHAVRIARQDTSTVEELTVLVPEDLPDEWTGRLTS